MRGVAFVVAVVGAAGEPGVVEAAGAALLAVGISAGVAPGGTVEGGVVGAVDALAGVPGGGVPRL